MASSRSIHRILVADDEPTICSLVQEALVERGHFVQVCEDGESALRKLEKGRYSLLILDIMMPRLNGLELARRLREQGRTTPIILLAALPPHELGQFDRVAFVQKPFRFSEFFRTMDGLLKPVRS